MKDIIAWAFMATEEDGEYFIKDITDGSTTIYLKKPKPKKNPFDYSSNLPLWKPTKITIKVVK